MINERITTTTSINFGMIRWNFVSRCCSCRRRCCWTWGSLPLPQSNWTSSRLRRFIFRFLWSNYLDIKHSNFLHRNYFIGPIIQESEGIPESKDEWLNEFVPQEEEQRNDDAWNANHFILGRPEVAPVQF